MSDPYEITPQYSLKRVSRPEHLPLAVQEMAENHGWRAGLDLHGAHWDRYVATEPEALLASLKALPGEAFVEVPSLLAATNYLQHVIAGRDPRRFHDAAYDETNRRDRGALDRLIGSAARTAGHRTAGRLDRALRSATQGRRDLDALSDREQSTIHQALPHLLTQWGRAFEVNDAGGVREYEEAWDLANLTSQPQAARRAAACLVWLHADHGDLSQAEQWIARAHSVPASAPRYDAPLHLGATLIAIDRLDRPAIEGHLASLSQVPIGEYWAAEAWVRAGAASSVQEAVLVEKQINQQLKGLSKHFSESGAFRRHLLSSRARLAAICGELPPQVPAIDEPSEFDHVMAAAAAYRSGDMHAVLREAAQAIDSAAQRIQVMGLLLTAAARFSLGRTEAAASAFASAHARIEDERLYSAYSAVSADHLARMTDLTNLPVGAAPAPTVSAGLGALTNLTRRERQVMKFLTSGLSLGEIAQELFISPNTVKGITQGLYKKLGVHSRHEAADIAHRAGLA